MPEIHSSVPELLTVAQAAAILGLSRTLVNSLVAARALPSCRLGLGRGAIRIKRNDLLSFIEQREQGPRTSSKSAEGRRERRAAKAQELVDS